MIIKILIIICSTPNVEDLCFVALPTLPISFQSTVLSIKVVKHILKINKWMQYFSHHCLTIYLSVYLVHQCQQSFISSGGQAYTDRVGFCKTVDKKLSGRLYILGPSFYLSDRHIDSCWYLCKIMDCIFLPWKWACGIMKGILFIPMQTSKIHFTEEARGYVLKDYSSASELRSPWLRRGCSVAAIFSQNKRP